MMTLNVRIWEDEGNIFITEVMRLAGVGTKTKEPLWHQSRIKPNSCQTPGIHCMSSMNTASSEHTDLMEKA